MEFSYWELGLSISVPSKLTWYIRKINHHQILLVVSDHELEGKLLSVDRDGGWCGAKEASAPPVVCVGGRGTEAAGGAVDDHVVLAAVIRTDPGYAGARAAHLETGQEGSGHCYPLADM